jgi:DNA/RNA endonuclease YhcR with UshA esterase domain
MKCIVRKQVLVSVIAVLIIMIVGCAAAPPPAPPALPTVQAAVSATENPTQTKTAVPTPSSTKPAPSTTPQPPTATPTITASPSPTPSPTTSPTETTTPRPATAEPAAPTPGVTAVAPSAAIPLADLPNHPGEEVTINGQVISTASFSQGFKFTLDDGSGRATLLMWHTVYDNSWDAPKLNIGAAVRVTGEVGQYEGEWQIEPNFGGDVTVTTAGGDYAPSRAIGELANHIGELAQISGVILRLESTSSAVKIFVGDDTGETVVFVWRTVLDRIPNNVALGEPGTRVRVNGRVENYRSNLELVPALPYDVEVLP